MFILSDQIIILFPADTFSRKQLIFRPHYKHNKHKLLEKYYHACQSFAPTMPKVGSRYSKFCFEKKIKQLHLVLKKNAELGFLGSIQEESASMNAELQGRGGGEASDFSMVSMCLPF